MDDERHVEADDRPAQGTRSDGEDSRGRLVDAAVELVHEHYRVDSTVRDAFSFLTPRVVAERAGLSRALIYHHWSGSDAEPDAFAAFLTSVAERLWEHAVLPDELAALAADLPVDLDAYLVAMADYEMDRATTWGAAGWKASESLLIHGVLPASAGTSVVSGLAELYELMGAALGREPVPPLTYDDLALALSALTEGFALQARVAPDEALSRRRWRSEDSVAGANWSLLAIAAEGLLTHMTQPVEHRADPA